MKLSRHPLNIFCCIIQKVSCQLEMTNKQIVLINSIWTLFIEFSFDNNFVNVVSTHIQLSSLIKFWKDLTVPYKWILSFFDNLMDLNSRYLLKFKVWRFSFVEWIIVVCQLNLNKSIPTILKAFGNKFIFGLKEFSFTV